MDFQKAIIELLGIQDVIIETIIFHMKGMKTM